MALVPCQSGELGLRNPEHSLEYISGVSWPSTSMDISEPSHGRVFCEKFCSVYVVKVVLKCLKLAHRSVIYQAN